jgi:hypothetical protein
MATEFNLSWDSAALSTKSNQVDANFMKLKQGDNVIRIVANPSKIESHWEPTLDGSTRRVICLGPKCPICRKGGKPQRRYQLKVIDRADGQVKILEVGITVISQIQEYARDPEYGDPTGYDFKIAKTGSNLETKYTVKPSRTPKPLTEEEKKLVEESPSIESLNPVLTVEEIEALNLTILADSVSDLADTATSEWDEL